jgi:hypothetical protein
MYPLMYSNSNKTYKLMLCGNIPTQQLNQPKAKKKRYKKKTTDKTNPSYSDSVE